MTFNSTLTLLNTNYGVVFLGDDDDEGEDAEPGLSDYITHYLTLPWKVDIVLLPQSYFNVFISLFLRSFLQQIIAVDGFVSSSVFVVLVF